MFARSHRLVSLSLSVALACSALIGLTMSSAHADTLPGNTPATPLPAIVYGNGCSVPGPNLFLDVQFVGDPFAPPHVFPVFLRPACDMHDAGYDGGIVIDPVTGAVVNTTMLSRVAIDNLFLGELITLCSRQVPWWASFARQQCYGTANLYYSAVRSFASGRFDASPAVPGLQSTGTRLNN